MNKTVSIGPAGAPKDPEHYLWDFHFAGEPIFAFGNAPAYKQRKTRDLGNSLVLGFQPRKIFEGLEGTEKGGIMSREKVRARVEAWDGLPKHRISVISVTLIIMSGSNSLLAMTLNRLKENVLSTIKIANNKNRGKRKL